MERGGDAQGESGSRIQYVADLVRRAPSFLVPTLLLLALGAGTAEASCGGVIYARPKHVNPARRPPLAVGDSTMLLTVKAFARAGIEANARGCRPVYEGLNYLARRKRQHRLPKVVLLHLGLNGSISTNLIRRGLKVLAPSASSCSPRPAAGTTRR